jgi:hypothetical protein
MMTMKVMKMTATRFCVKQTFVSFGRELPIPVYLGHVVRHLKAEGKVQQRQLPASSIVSRLRPWSSSSSRLAPFPAAHPSNQLNSQMESQQPSASTRSSQHRKLVRKNTLNRYTTTTWLIDHTAAVRFKSNSKRSEPDSLDSRFRM